MINSSLRVSFRKKIQWDKYVMLSFTAFDSCSYLPCAWFLYGKLLTILTTQDYVNLTIHMKHIPVVSESGSSLWDQRCAVAGSHGKGWDTECFRIKVKHALPLLAPTSAKPKIFGRSLAARKVTLILFCWSYQYILILIYICILITAL